MKYEAMMRCGSFVAEHQAVETGFLRLELSAEVGADRLGGR